MPTTTTNYGFDKPLVNDATDQDVWGTYVNGDLDDLDALLKTTLDWTPSPQTASFAVTAPTTGSATAGSSKLLYLCNATGGAITVSLPAASTCSGMTVAFKKTDASANAVTIDGNASEVIDGALTQALSSQYSYLIIASNGTAWYIISQTPPSVTVPILRQQVTTATGAFTFTPPANTVASTVFKFTLTGGGGSGCNYNGGSGSSGAAGGTVVWFVSGLTALTAYSGTIGPGGAGVTAVTPGNAGTSSTFTVSATTITAAAGGGGLFGLTSVPAGGSGTNGTLVIRGGDGGISAGGAAQGGGSFWGGGGGTSNASTANPGVAPGSGGGASGGAGTSSGAGAPGIFMAEWIA